MKARRLQPAAVVGALGVVFGDIGTSPLYALEFTLKAASDVPQEQAVLGVLSLMFWSLLLIVTLKYIVLVMRADNEGEGGILALFALVQRRMLPAAQWNRWVVALGALGAGLFFCDALMTPAITVLGAVEGLELLSPGAHAVVVPVTLLIIVALFILQRHGTERIGRLFGPVMILWFGILAITGAGALLQRPAVLAAINPLHGFMLLHAHPGVALAVLGGVFLTMTGAEALYADMGHFSKAPVRTAWFILVWPSLLLSYFGQGAMVLGNPAAAHLPLFSLVTPAALPWFVILATAAAVIASQACITGAFSMARQAVQLDLLPRLRILQTSAREHGQIYVPAVNWFILVAACAFVLGFRSASALGSAYGAAVSATMAIETLLGAALAVTAWKWARWRVALIFGGLAVIELTYVTANLAKFFEGAWVPVLLAVLVFGLMMTWRGGRLLLRAALRNLAVPLADLPRILDKVQRVSGTAVFLASDAQFVPSAFMRNLEHNRVAHERIVLLNIEIMRTPRQDPADRVRIEQPQPGVYTVTARFGFMETPDVNEALKQCRARGLKLFAQDCSFFLGWHLVVPRPRSGYEGIRRRLFAWLQRRSTQAVEFFRMPERRVVVLATQVEL